MWYIEFDKNNKKNAKAYGKNFKKNVKASLRKDREEALHNLKIASRAINVVAGLVLVITIIYVIF